jgi:two-component system sensor histidine kinase UhpB
LRLMFNRSAKDESDPQRQTFADAERVTEEVIQNIRNICSTLRPQVLDDLGLVAGLEWHVKNFGARSNLKIDFEHNGIDEARLSPILQSTIFRVIQEALTNVARHAGTNRASVVLWMTEQDVLFRIQDRGRGFKPDADMKGHNGISSMRERISLVNGQYDLKSRPGRGTIIQVQIPLTIHNNGKSNHS